MAARRSLRRTRSTRIAAQWLLAALLATVWLTTSPITVRLVSAADPTIAAAGDIACDPTDPQFRGGSGSGLSCMQEATSNLLVGHGYSAVLSLGDNQYDCGSLAAYQQVYDPSWGRVKSITHPVPGNHEYLTSGGTGCDPSNAGAAGYFDYFGSAAGTPGRGYYSFDVGAWHLIALNSECTDAGGCAAGTPQAQWLAADLAAHPDQCLLAYWHIPLFSSGGRASGGTQNLWNILYAAHADLILNGHDHIYERFAPQTPAGQPDPSGGITQITVGTGGGNHTSIAAIAANSVVRNTDSFGVLGLTLHPSSVTWNFHAATGNFSDSGTTACHNATSIPASTPTPKPTPTGTPVSGTAGTYRALTPARVLDSRISLGGSLFHSQARQTIAIANGRSGVPTNALAVTGNVTVTGQSHGGYVTVAPSLTSGVQPPTSTINFPLADTRANGVTVPLAPGGTLDFMYWTASGADTSHVIFDVTGYFAAGTSGATYHALTPARVLDSRVSSGAGLFHSETRQTVAIANGRSGVPPNAVAVTGNVTVTGQSHSGYVTVAPALNTGVQPATSTINFPLADTRANGVTVPLAAGGNLDFMYWTASGADVAQVIFDVTGYFGADTTGATYHALTPARVLDSRVSLGGGLFRSEGMQHVPIANGRSGVPPNAVAVTGNVTVTGQSHGGYVTVAPALTSGLQPPTSTINFPIRDTRANGVTAPLASGALLDFMYWTASAADTTQVIFDVTGYLAR